MKKNIVLVGFMGSGKSAVGRSLAKALQRNFVDLDEIIVEREKRPIIRIFQESGESYFRSVEKSLVKEFSRQSGLVIACGGGVVMDQGNMDNLSSNGIIIYLHTTPEVIWQRTKGLEHRPLLDVANPQERIIELLNQRQPFYAKADFTVQTSDKTIDQVTKEVIKIVEND